MHDALTIVFYDTVSKRTLECRHLFSCLLAGDIGLLSTPIFL